MKISKFFARKTSEGVNTCFRVDEATEHKMQYKLFSISKDLTEDAFLGNFFTMTEVEVKIKEVVFGIEIPRTNAVAGEARIYGPNHRERGLKNE